ncbi:Acyl-CoA synthetase (AMP-forming)/AMP-acid ligase II [Tessaracoccus bendigoensis DSM 12906]|uniref:Acyl-CoA synthetase (AMP-forming)/AMP-acid ligase II n=1 Tax=Tessaracoccus bendigoensis DSM 12906 TaxID=1123357 RepID=A0A1M6LMG2_9ACTN|nr:AMP-binding protein [Tessaracoccus bendigoensis]SHJ72421.1 Acyl-CoA synthetase (AMP-forming)/AMP-acid ligase II [Tessaracoccus bendigoensis DSM 12906]
MAEHLPMEWLSESVQSRAESGLLAISTPTMELSQGQLAIAVHELSQRIAPTLGGKVVAVRFPRGDPRGLVAALAAWRVGGVPFFLDTDRTAHGPLLAAAGAHMGLSPTSEAAEPGRAWLTSIELTATGVAPGERPPGLPAGAAYLIATSGSTARPRICVNHGAALRNTVLGLVDRYRVDEQARTLQFAAYNYDAWLGDALPTLWAGGVLVYGTPGPWSTFAAVNRRMAAGRVTHAVAPPSVWARLDLENRLRVAVSAGETLFPELARRLSGFADTVINAYGPTEAAVCTTTHVYQPDEDSGGSVPLGTPLPGVELDVVPTERSGVGLLRIRGMGVANGYLGDVPSQGTVDRFGSDKRGAYFQTSDLVREMAGGLVHVGRSDRAIKRLGRLVDLDRVEAVVRSLPNVEECVVYERGGRLVCEYESAAELVDPVAAVQTVLELWEIPQVWRGVGDLKRGPSDKLLRGVHPEESVPDPVSRIWAEVLGRPASRGSFFALGGDSVLAMDLIAAVLNQLGVEVELADFIADPTLAFLIHQVGDRSEEQ